MPEPETPVMHTSIPIGMDRSTSFRLFSPRALDHQLAAVARSTLLRHGYLLAAAEVLARDGIRVLGHFLDGAGGDDVAAVLTRARGPGR